MQACGEIHVCNASDGDSVADVFVHFGVVNQSFDVNTHSCHVLGFVQLFGREGGIFLCRGNHLKAMLFQHFFNQKPLVVHDLRIIHKRNRTLVTITATRSVMHPG
jgi:hypothetical protein